MLMIFFLYLVNTNLGVYLGFCIAISLCANCIAIYINFFTFMHFYTYTIEHLTVTFE